MAGERGEGIGTGRRQMTQEGWRRILRIMDKAFEGYLTGLVALRKRVVAEARRKLTARKVLHHPERRRLGRTRHPQR